MKKFGLFIASILDLFYPLFKRLMNKQTYYYAACGGGNTLLGFVFYYLAFHFWLDKENLDLGFYALKPHVAAFVISFIITFPIGFALSKYVVWNDSYLRGRQQLSRHLMLVLLFVFINIGLLKLFVEVFHWWPMPSQVLTTSIILVFSYLSQKHYSFK